MTTSIVYLEGRFVAEHRARVSAFDRGFLYADGLFETVRTYDGKPFLLESHLSRLRRGARSLGFSAPGTNAEWRTIVRELLERNRCEDADVAVRITVTRGVGGEGLLPPRRPRPTVLVSLRLLDPRLPRLRRTGVAVTVVPFAPRPGAPLAGTKTTDYTAAILAKRRAKSRRAFEALYSLPDGTLSEGATSNLFLVVRGRVFTAPIGGDVLPGITRGRILEIAKRAGIPTREHRVTTADLSVADEAFLTASTIEILPIRSADGVRVGSGAWPVVRRLQRLYRRTGRDRECDD